MASFRDRFFTPEVARTITSPSAILTTGAGAAVGMLVGGPLGAVGAGIAAYVARVLIAVPRPVRRAGVDLRGLEDPWHSIMREILEATDRFDRAVRAVDAGPLRDRLAELGERLGSAVHEALRVARAGHDLSQARRRIDGGRLHAELAAVRDSPPTPHTAATVQALEAQIGTVARMDATITDVRERLRLADARIDETVTRAIELSVARHDAGELAGLGAEVDSVLGEVVALRSALEETQAADRHQLPPPMPGTATS